MAVRMYTVAELEEMETTSQGHHQDYKVEELGFRVALTRGSVPQAEYEVLVAGRWYAAEPRPDGSGFDIFAWI